MKLIGSKNIHAKKKNKKAFHRSPRKANIALIHEFKSRILSYSADFKKIVLFYSFSSDGVSVCSFVDVSLSLRLSVDCTGWLLDTAVTVVSVVGL